MKLFVNSICAGIIVLIVSACSDVPDKMEAPVTIEPQEEVDLKLDHNDTLHIHNFIDSLLSLNNGVSISVSAGYKDEILFSFARGFENLEDSTLATPHSQYRIGSTSKVLGSTILFTFIESGQIRLDDPIQKWVPEFPEKEYPITIRHLLTHTSGIRHYNGHLPQDKLRHTINFKSFDQSVALFKDDDLLHKPGSKWHYSSYGFNLIQGVMENIADSPIETVMDSLLFIPNKMNSSLVEVYKERPANLVISYNNDGDDQKANRARPGNPSYKKIAGGMVSTPEDLVKFMQALDHCRIITDSTFEMMMMRPYDFAEWQAYGWRYGERAKDSTTVYHHGGTSRGFVSLITFDPEHEIYVAVAANYNTFYDVRSDMAYFLMDFVKEKTKAYN